MSLGLMPSAKLGATLGAAIGAMLGAALSTVARMMSHHCIEANYFV